MTTEQESGRPRTLPLGAIGSVPVGGKAAGLARLLAIGLPVPAGFVIVDARQGALPDDLGARYRALCDDASGERAAGVRGADGPDCAVAVRSSALGEDSAAASFAGQYETILDVCGERDLVRAIERCLASLSSARAGAYQQHVAPDEDDPRDEGPRMCVVVQRMVAARAAGVLFTADPVTGRRAHLVIDAVRGLGEALVGGHASPDHYVMGRDGRTLVSHPDGATEVITALERRALTLAALVAEERFGTELDLEFAIDAAGDIHWLQARPITTLGADPNELDTPRTTDDHVYTRCNVGEMFPGVSTPLSFSFTARAIDVGMQRMQLRIGIAHDVTSACRFIAMFHGHLFLDLTTMAETPRALGSGPEQLALSICGRPVDELSGQRSEPLAAWRRVVHGVRYARYLLGQRGARRQLARLRQTLAAERARDAARIGSPPGARAQWEAIDARLPAIADAMDFHLVSSAGSGVLSTTLLAIVAGGATPSGADHARVASLLAGADGVESADIALGAERVQRAIAAQRDAAAQFVDATPDAALAWLLGGASGVAGEAFREYLGRHGHRAIKELELRQPEWREDPTPLLKPLQVGVRHRLAGGTCSPRPADLAHERASAFVRLLTRLARQAVRSREETKSGLVDVTTHFKRAYRSLAVALVDEKRLPDVDALFFLTHSELGQLVRDERAGLADRAVARRDVLPYQESLEFPEVFVGEAVPVRDERDARAVDGDARVRVVTGAPVSRGRIVGKARVVLRLEDAEALEQGEILVAKVTDVGWTPYFSLISGLVTDVGSAVSHGAVVAREYGLPAVVNTRIATRVFATGDRLVLDGARGVVRLAEAGE